MTGLIFSCLAIFIYLYHLLVHIPMKKGKIREGYCAIWIGDLLFSIFGTIITLTTYTFSFMPFFNLRNILFFISFLLITLLLLVLAPSGLGIMGQKAPLSTDEMIMSEYRFNQTMEIIRNLLLLMLLLLPIFFSMSTTFPEYFIFLSRFGEGELCSSFCLITFLILLPISLRQALFWLRNVTVVPGEAENHLLKMERAKFYYKSRNIRI